MKRPDLKRRMAFEKIVAKNFPELKKDTCSQTILKEKKKVTEITCQMSRYITEL